MMKFFYCWWCCSCSKKSETLYPEVESEEDEKTKYLNVSVTDETMSEIINHNSYRFSFGSLFSND